MAVTERYRHRQVGRGSALIISVVFVMMLTVFVTVPLPAGILLLAFLAAIGAIFTSITTIVTERAFVHHFGLGFWRKEYPLRDILSVEPVRNRWWYGFGIRLTPHGWLYNTWGLDAVEIRLVTGRTFRVGTDEPGVLGERIRTARMELSKDRSRLT